MMCQSFFPTLKTDSWLVYSISSWQKFFPPKVFSNTHWSEGSPSRPKHRPKTYLHARISKAVRKGNGVSWLRHDPEKQEREDSCKTTLEDGRPSRYTCQNDILEAPNGHQPLSLWQSSPSPRTVLTIKNNHTSDQASLCESSSTEAKPQLRLEYMVCCLLRFNILCRSQGVTKKTKDKKAAFYTKRQQGWSLEIPNHSQVWSKVAIQDYPSKDIIRV